MMYGPDQFTFDVEKRASAGFTVLPLLWGLATPLLAAGIWLAVRFRRRRSRKKGGRRGRLRLSVRLEREKKEMKDESPSGP
jgi:cytochrome c-type biogenesis protein CcmH/NrfF